MFLIRQALACGKSAQYGSLSFDIKPESDWSIFATHTVSETKSTRSLQSTPKSFIESFRIVNFLNPHIGKILAWHFEIYRFENPERLADCVVTFFQVLTNGIDNQVYFEPDISYEDLKMTNMLNIKPNFALIKKLLRYIQKQTIKNHGSSKITLGILWEAILFCLQGIIVAKGVPRIEALFQNIFQTYTRERTESSLHSKFLTLFKEIVKAELRGFDEFRDKCQEVFEIFGSTPQSFRTILLIGSTGSGKSTIISTVSKLYATLIAKNFNVTTLDIDSTPDIMLLGGTNTLKQPRFQGIIQTLVDQTTGDIREKETNLIRPWFSKKAISAETTILMDKAYDWIVLEGTYDKKFKDNLEVFERLFATAKLGYIISYDGLKTKIPGTMKLIVNCDKLTHLSPSSIAELNIVYVDDSMFQVENEYSRRLSALTSLAEYFKTIEPVVDSLFNHLILPILNLISNESEQKKMLFFFSIKYSFTVFWELFEIMLNECRKLEISYGNVTEIDVERAARVKEEMKSKYNRRRSSIAGLENDQSVKDVLFSLKVPTGNQSQNSNNSARHVTMIESSCIFCLIWTIGNNYRPNSRSQFTKIFLEKVKGYYRYFGRSADTSSNASFMKYFIKPVESQRRGIFDYCFDVREQKWVPWTDLKIPEDQIISPSFFEVKLDNKEMVRFNPLLEVSPIKHKSTVDLAAMTRLLPESDAYVYVDTPTAKKMRYMMDYMIAYRKPILFVSEHQTGKTSVIRNKIKNIFNGNRQKPFYYSITPWTTKERLASNIEDSLSCDSRDRYNPAEDNEGVIFIDDLHLSSM